MLFRLLFSAIGILLQNCAPALALFLQEFGFTRLFIVPELLLFFSLLLLPLAKPLKRLGLLPLEVLRRLLVLEVLGRLFVLFGLC